MALKVAIIDIVAPIQRTVPLRIRKPAMVMIFLVPAVTLRSRGSYRQVDHTEFFMGDNILKLLWFQCLNPPKQNKKPLFNLENLDWDLGQGQLSGTYFLLPDAMGLGRVYMVYRIISELWGIVAEFMEKRPILGLGSGMIPRESF